MVEKIEDIIRKQMDLLEKVGHSARERWGDLVYPETIIALYKEVNKDIRMEKMKQEREEREKTPSQRQIKYAKDLGILSPESYTKEELSRLIKEKTSK